MKRVSVFCGSSMGIDPAYANSARALGQVLAARDIALIYGGGNCGLMGEVAVATMKAGGHVTGVMPKFLVEKEVAKLDVHDLRIVASMHERKAMMAEISDGFIALPGGIGTLEEFCEIQTWAVLGLHAKPVGILNVNGFYDHLLKFLDTAVESGFIKPRHREIILVGSEAGELVERMSAWKGVAEPKYSAVDRA